VVVGSIYQVMDVGFNVMRYHPDLGTSPQQTKVQWEEIEKYFLFTLENSRTYFKKIINIFSQLEMIENNLNKIEERTQQLDNSKFKKVILQDIGTELESLDKKLDELKDTIEQSKMLSVETLKNLTHESSTFFKRMGDDILKTKYENLGQLKESIITIDRELITMWQPLYKALSTKHETENKLKMEELTLEYYMQEKSFIEESIKALVKKIESVTCDNQKEKKKNIGKRIKHYYPET